MPTILIVDDEFSIADALQELLSWEGYEVRVASNGEKGLAEVAHGKPDAIVADYMMPTMDGIAMLRALKANPAWANIPVILMSAAPLADAPGAELADVRLRKPFAGAAVLGALSLLLDGKG